MGELAAKLVDELCSLLDETIILSICSDYDLSQPGQFQAARDVLLSISANVEAEEASGFNPSGLGANDIVDIADAASRDSGVGLPNALEGDLRSNDGLTTTTESSVSRSSLSASSSKTSARDAPEPPAIKLFEGLGTENEKETRLGEIFPSLKPIDIKLALQKAKGDADIALDALLNTAFLEQIGERQKGVDGFYSPDGGRPTKKSKGKKKKAAVRIAESTSRSTSASDSPDIEETHRQNIAYLAERLPLSENDVESRYYALNSSMGASVVEILDNYMIALAIDSSDAGGHPDVGQQVQKYPWIPSKYMAPIFEVTHPNRQHALDLIQILADYYEKPAYLKYKVSYNIAASREDISSLEGDDAVNTLASRTAAKSKATSWNQPSTLPTARLETTRLADALHHSRQSAALSYKKGSSSPLYRQAAGFYSERARELAQRHRQAISVEAGHMVDQSSTADQIDLHGVTVQDGVTIAIDRVWRWWNSLGEDQARKAREGFTVVTGLGRHTADGRSRLRVNVFKALVADGWKVEVLTGQYLVTGRRR